MSAAANSCLFNKAFGIVLGFMDSCDGNRYCHTASMSNYRLNSEVKVHVLPY